MWRFDSLGKKIFIGNAIKISLILVSEQFLTAKQSHWEKAQFNPFHIQT